jgi:hypothetical protein
VGSEMNLRSLKMKNRKMQKNSRLPTKFGKGTTKFSATDRTRKIELACDSGMPVDINIDRHAIIASERHRGQGAI